MDEQRLQAIEQNVRNGNRVSSADTKDLIAEVRRLQQQAQAGNAWRVSVDLIAERDVALAERDNLLAEQSRREEATVAAGAAAYTEIMGLRDSLTEARRVLKHVLSELKQTSDWGVVDDLQTEIAAVLAQEEK